MNRPVPPARGSRRIVKQIVLTYTLEDDPEQREHTMTLTRRGGGAVDGVIWSRRLMDRLAYMDGPGSQAQRVTQRPARGEDGWVRSGGQEAALSVGGDVVEAGPAESGGMSTMSTGVENPECIWLHQESCSWLSYCDPG